MKKKLKGMTLMEIVVAMAVLMVISLMLVIGCQSAVMNARISKRVSDKCAVQAPIAATHNANNSDRADVQLKVEAYDSSGAKISKEDDEKMTVYSYEVKVGENTARDRSGNYRYFVLKK